MKKIHLNDQSAIFTSQEVLVLKLFSNFYKYKNINESGISNFIVLYLFMVFVLKFLKTLKTFFYFFKKLIDNLFTLGIVCVCALCHHVKYD